jgi:hypothetical protein
MESEQENRRGILRLAYLVGMIGAFTAGSVSRQVSNGKYWVIIALMVTAVAVKRHAIFWGTHLGPSPDA